MRDCEYYQELMSRLLDEDLTEEETASLRAHVRACPECRQMFTAFTGMTNALRDDPAEPPRDLARGVLERIADEDGARPARPRRKKKGRPVQGRTPSPWIRLGAAACLVLLAAGGATLVLRGGRDEAAGETAGVPAGGGETALYQQAAPEEAETEAGSAPMMISAPDAQAAADTAEAPAAASADAAPAVTETPAPSPAPDQPLPVYDAARNRIGSIPPENIAAFAALVADAGPAGGSYEYLLKVEYRGRTYAFATDPDSGSLVWWEEPSTDPVRSPGTLADLHRLITTEAPALPE